MNMENIMEFFYEKASKRIKDRIKDSGLKQYEVYQPDTKQISRIICNNRTKNNPYLICDAVLENRYKAEDTGRYILCGLLNVKELHFSSKKEILWGTDEEIDSYIFDLFKRLWEEVSIDNSPYDIDRELLLFDYVPYAKYSSYWKILLSENNQYPAISYGIYEDTVIKNIDSAREEAFLFLYQKCQTEFLKLFKDFTNSTLSFHKIDKVFKNIFIEKTFIPMLKRYTPNSSSLGLRVRELIFADLSHSAELIHNKMTDNRAYKKSLIKASSGYIIELENIQKNSLFLLYNNSIFLFKYCCNIQSLKYGYNPRITFARFNRCVSLRFFIKRSSSSLSLSEL